MDTVQHTISPDVNNISSWSQADYELLSSDIIHSLDSTQIQQMLHPEWIPLSAVAGLNNVQLANFIPSLVSVSADWLNSLTISALQGLTNIQAGQISLTVLGGMDNAHLSALSATQVAALHNIKSLSHDQFGLLDLTAIPASTMSGWGQSAWAGTTAKQMSLLTTDQINAMQNATWLPLAAVSGIQPSQVLVFTRNYGRFNAEWFNQMRLDSFQVLDSSRLKQISAAVWAQIDNAHITALTPAQIGTVVQQAYLTGAQFALLDLTAVSPAAMSGWGQSSWAGITAQQMSLLTTDQINAMQNATWLPLAAVSGIQPSQVLVFTSNYGRFNAAWFNQMRLDSFATLDTGRLKQISAEVWAQIDVAHFTTLNATQIAVIKLNFATVSAEGINGLSADAFQGLTTTQLSQLTASTIAGISDTRLSALTAAQLVALSDLSQLNSHQFSLLTLASMSTAQIARWTPDQYATITPAEFATLSTAQISAMTNPAALPLTVVSTLSVAQVNAITTDFSTLPDSWLNSLSSTALQGLTPYQFSHLSSLSPDEVNKITNIAALSNAQFSQLNLTGVPVSVMRTWTQEVWAGLTAAQVSSMSNAQIDSFQHANWLPAAAAAGLLPSQMAALTAYYGQFNSDWFNNLQLASFTALDTSRLNTIYASDLSGMDRAHLSALSASQVASMNNLGAIDRDKFGFLNISAFSTNQIANLTLGQYQGLTQAQIDTLSDTQIGALVHPEWLPPGLLNNLSLAQFQSMTPDQVSALTSASVSRLDAAHIAVYTGDLTTLSNDALLAIESHLTAAQRNTLTSAQQSLLTLNQSAEQSLISSLNDSVLKNIMQSLDDNGASLFSFAAIESVLKSFAGSLTSNLTAAQYADLTSYTRDIGQVLGTGSSVYSVVNGLVTGANGASVDWCSPEDGKLTRIGSLSVDSSATQFSQLITTWMDGGNLPVDSSTSNTTGRPLFANGTPTLGEIKQGYIGDCGLISTFQAIANVCPDYIKSMIVQNSNDTYSVRFFNNGVADWVTVDNHTYKDSAYSSSSSWVAIMERAYLQYRSTYTGLNNEYNAIAGVIFGAAADMTGDSVTHYYGSTKDKWDSVIVPQLKAAVLSNEPVMLSSWESSVDDGNGLVDFVNAHQFAVTGYDANTDKFTLTNPWGADHNSGGWNGTFEATTDQMWEDGRSYVGWVNSSGATGVAGQLVTAMASMPAASASVSPASMSQTSNANLAQLAVAHAA